VAISASGQRARADPQQDAERQPGDSSDHVGAPAVISRSVLPNSPEGTDQLRVLDEQPALDLEQQRAFTVIEHDAPPGRPGPVRWRPGDSPAMS
jgi:hypothetical protein